VHGSVADNVDKMSAANSIPRPLEELVNNGNQYHQRGQQQFQRGQQKKMVRAATPISPTPDGDENLGIGNRVGAGKLEG
jgi:hypothetical protein